MTERLRPLIAGIVERLLAATMPGESVSLDTVGEQVGAASISYEEIGAILDALERSGRHIAEPGIAATQALHRVLQAARELRTSNGRLPTLQQLEEQTGLERSAVIAALRFADTLQR